MSKNLSSHITAVKNSLVQAISAAAHEHDFETLLEMVEVAKEMKSRFPGAWEPTVTTEEAAEIRADNIVGAVKSIRSRFMNFNPPHELGTLKGAMDAVQEYRRNNGLIASP